MNLMTRRTSYPIIGKHRTLGTYGILYRHSNRKAFESSMNGSRTKLNHDWFILRSLVSKDFKLKYRRSILGVLWSMLNPLLMMIVISTVFSYFFRFQIEHFPVYLILGQTLFSFMSDATSTAMSSIIDSAPLIKKIRINKLLFPLEKATFALVNFSISLIAVALVMLFFQIRLTPSILLLPLLIIFVYIFSLGLGLILSALAVFFRDIVHLWGVIIAAWTYFTPLFYPVEILPDWAMSAMAFNPMYYYVNYFRDIALYGTVPGIRENLICIGFALFALVIGIGVFKRMQKRFILYV